MRQVEKRWSARRHVASLESQIIEIIQVPSNIHNIIIVPPLRNAKNSIKLKFHSKLKTPKISYDRGDRDNWDKIDSLNFSFKRLF